MTLDTLRLAALATFRVATVGLARSTAWRRTAVAFAAVLSQGHCLGWWNDAIVGALVDRASLVGLLLSTRVARIEPSETKGA